MTRLTLNNITAALRDEFGGDIELVRGRGYFWVFGDTDHHGRCSSWFSQGIYVNALSHISNPPTIEAWVAAVRDLVPESDDDRADRLNAKYGRDMFRPSKEIDG